MKRPRPIGPATAAAELGIELGALRSAISEEYEEVARDPGKGFHFHTGNTLARILGYPETLLEGIPATAVDSFAGTGNPFGVGPLRRDEKVVDVGCGGGIDSLIAAREVGPGGSVIGVDMTPAMLDRARRAAEESGATNVDFREGHAEELPVEDGWADVVISNGVLNLTPDKGTTLQEWHRVLAPHGRLQVADILVGREVPIGAKRKIDLWTG